MLTNTAIEVDGISKRYRIGNRRKGSTTMAGSFADLFTQPLRNLKRLRSLSKFDENSPDSDRVLWALKDVSFELKQGEALGVVGHNGSGKSTLLKILSMITEPTAGRVKIRGRVGSLLEVGTGFHPELTGRENVYLNGTILGMTKGEIGRKFDEIIEFSGVETFIDTPVKHYSSGMKVRLAFSVAAHLEPEILLIDEVLAVGDLEFQQKCLGKMREVAGAGRTVMFVSHNMGAVANLTSRSLLLTNGVVVAEGDTETVIDAYRASFNSQQTVTADKLPRTSPDYGKEVRLVSVLPSYDSAGGFGLTQPLVFEIGVKSQVTQPDLAFGITLLDISGAAIMYTVTPRDVKVKAGGEHQFQLTLSDTRLAPGGYQLAISVIDGDITETKRLPFDVLNPCIPFAVNPDGSIANQPLEWRRDWMGHSLIPHCNVSVNSK